MGTWLGVIVETRGRADFWGVVLETPEHKGFGQVFVSYLDRDRRPTSRTEYDAPLGFWRGEHGVNWQTVEFLFGRFSTV